jgi:hypothetical protein
LLETTGLANPAPLASVLWLDDQLESAVKLDSIITVSFVFDNSIISDLELRLLTFSYPGLSTIQAVIKLFVGFMPLISC